MSRNLAAHIVEDEPTPLHVLHRWNDTAIDRLAGTVDDHGNEIAVLRPALERVAKMETAISSLLEATRDERNIARHFRTETRERFDAIDGAHAQAPTKSWIAVVVAVIGLIGTVLAALIGAYVVVHSGGGAP